MHNKDSPSYYMQGAEYNSLLMFPLDAPVEGRVVRCEHGGWVEPVITVKVAKITSTLMRTIIQSLFISASRRSP